MLSPPKLSAIRQVDDPDPLSVAPVSPVSRSLRPLRSSERNLSRRHQVKSKVFSSPQSLEAPAVSDQNLNRGSQYSSLLLPSHSSLKQPGTMAQTATRPSASLDIWTGDIITPKPARSRAKSNSVDMNGRSPAARRTESAPNFDQGRSSTSRRRRRITSATADLPTPNTSAFNISHLDHSLDEGGANFTFNSLDEGASPHPDFEAGTDFAPQDVRDRAVNGVDKGNPHSSDGDEFASFELDESEDLSMVELSEDALARYRRLSSIYPINSGDSNSNRRKSLRQNILSSSRKRTPKKAPPFVPMPTLNSDEENRFSSPPDRSLGGDVKTPNKNSNSADSPSRSTTPVGSHASSARLASFGNDPQRRSRQGLNRDEELGTIQDGGDARGSLAEQDRTMAPQPDPLMEQLQARTRIVVETVAAADPELAFFRRSGSSGLHSSLVRHSELDEGDTPTDMRMDVDDDDFFLSESDAENRVGVQAQPSTSEAHVEEPSHNEYHSLSPILEQTEPSTLDAPSLYPALPTPHKQIQSAPRAPASIHDQPRRIFATPNYARSVPRIGSPLKQIVSFSSSPAQSTPSAMMDVDSRNNSLLQPPSTLDPQQQDGSPISRKRTRMDMDPEYREEYSHKVSPLALPPLRPRKRTQTRLRDDTTDTTTDRNQNVLPDSSSGQAAGGTAGAGSEDPLSEEWRRSAHLFRTLSEGSQLAWDENVDGNKPANPNREFAGEVQFLDRPSSFDSKNREPERQSTLTRSRDSNSGRSSNRLTEQPSRPRFDNHTNASLSNARSGPDNGARAPSGDDIFYPDVSNLASEPSSRTASHTDSNSKASNQSRNKDRTTKQNANSVRNDGDDSFSSNQRLPKGKPNRKPSLHSIVSGTEFHGLHDQNEERELDDRNLQKKTPDFERARNSHGVSAKSTEQARKPSRIRKNDHSDPVQTKEPESRMERESEKENRLPLRSSRAQPAGENFKAAKQSEPQEERPRLSQNPSGRSDGDTAARTASRVESSRVPPPEISSRNQESENNNQGRGAVSKLVSNKRTGLFPTPSKADAFARPSNFLIFDDSSPAQNSVLDAVSLHPTIPTHNDNSLFRDPNSAIRIHPFLVSSSDAIDETNGRSVPDERIDDGDDNTSKQTKEKPLKSKPKSNKPSAENSSSKTGSLPADNSLKRHRSDHSSLNPSSLTSNSGSSKHSSARSHAELPNQQRQNSHSNSSSKPVSSSSSRHSQRANPAKTAPGSSMSASHSREASEAEARPPAALNASTRSLEGSDVWMELERSNLTRDTQSSLQPQASSTHSAQGSLSSSFVDVGNDEGHSSTQISRHHDGDETWDGPQFEHSYLTGDSDEDRSEYLDDHSNLSEPSQPSYLEAHNVAKIPLKAPAASPDVSMVSTEDYSGEDDYEEYDESEESEDITDEDEGEEEERSDNDNECDNSAISGSLPPTSSSATGLLGKVANIIRSVVPWQSHPTDQPAAQPPTATVPHYPRPTHPLLQRLPFLPKVEPWTKSHYMIFDLLYQLFRHSPELFAPEIPENYAELEKHPQLHILVGMRLSRFGYIVTLGPKHLVLCALFSRLLVFNTGEYEATYGRALTQGNIRPGPAGAEVSTRDVVVRLMSMMITQRKRRDENRGLVREYDREFGAFSPGGETEWYDLARLRFWMGERIAGRL